MDIGRGVHGIFPEFSMKIPFAPPSGCRRLQTAAPCRQASFGGQILFEHGLACLFRFILDCIPDGITIIHHRL
jgi:hypothetical protein